MIKMIVHGGIYSLLYGMVVSATCDVTTCDGNAECWDNGGQQQAECRCKTGYISLQNHCIGEITYKYEYTI